MPRTNRLIELRSDIKMNNEIYNSSFDESDGITEINQQYNEESLHICHKYKWLLTSPLDKLVRREKIPYKFIIEIFKVILITLQVMNFTVLNNPILIEIKKSEQALRNYYSVCNHGCMLYSKSSFLANINEYIIQGENLNNRLMNKFHVTDTYLHATYKNDSTLYIVKKDMDNYIKNLFSNTDNLASISTLIIGDRITANYRFVDEESVSLSTKITFVPYIVTGSFYGELTVTVNRKNFVFTHKNAYSICINILSSASIVLSTFFSLLAVARYYRLVKEVEIFCLKFKQRFLSFKEKCSFVDKWLILTIVSNFLLLLAILLANFPVLETWSTPFLINFLIGLGSLFVWIGVLRNLNYFSYYNLIFLTVEASLPNILRIFICFFGLLIGFTICGFINFSHFHPKFAKIDLTFASIFGLMIGDDIFTTFQSIKNMNSIITIFSRIYVTTIVIVFMHFISTMFLAIVSQRYEYLMENGRKKIGTLSWILELCNCNDCINFRFIEPHHDFVSKRKL